MPRLEQARTHLVAGLNDPRLAADRPVLAGDVEVVMHHVDRPIPDVVGVVGPHKDRVRTRRRRTAGGASQPPGTPRQNQHQRQRFEAWHEQGGGREGKESGGRRDAQAGGTESPREGGGSVPQPAVPRKLNSSPRGPPPPPAC
ncbi:MAG: hypothetical protein ACK56I_23385, partial [bacterium]